MAMTLSATDAEITAVPGSMPGMLEKPPPELERGLLASVKYVVQQFLEDSHYGLLHETLSKQWNRLHSLSAAMKLMESYGVTLSQEEVQQISQMDDETRQINYLVSRMPQQSNEQFQHFFLQLQLIVSTATRVRQGLEEGRPEQVETALNDAESTGIAPYILKMAVVQAGSEVTNMKRGFQGFVKESDARMSRLIRGQDDLVQVQKKLMAAQTQLSTYTSQGNDRAKKVVLGMAGGSDSAVLAASFKGWFGAVRAEKEEAIIAAEYEDRIIHAEKALLEYRSAQLSGVRNVLTKKAMEQDQILMAEVFKLMKDEVEEKKWNLENQGKIQELEARIRACQDSKKESAKRVMVRVGDGNDSALVGMIFQGWVQFMVEYRKDREIEDKVKETEKRVGEYMKGKSDNARNLLGSMSSGTESGLLHTTLSAWKDTVAEAREEKRLEEILNNTQGKFSSFADRNAQSAKNVMSKASYHIDYMVTLRTFNAWRLESRMEKTKGMYQGKVDAKKQQLLGVQQMFRSFAQQLETGLKEGADSGRDLREGPPHRSSKRLGKMEGSVSLPDIHANRGPGSGTPTRQRLPGHPEDHRQGQAPPQRREAWKE